jgi:hypothetical protein
MLLALQIVYYIAYGSRGREYVGRPRCRWKTGFRASSLFEERII